MRFGGTDELEDLVDVGEGFASPVFADLAEQAVLDGIPLGSAGWIVTDGNDEAERSADGVLKRFPPGAASWAVTASAISQDEQFAGGRVSLASLLYPPLSDGVDGKGRCVVAVPTNTAPRLACVS